MGRTPGRDDRDRLLKAKAVWTAGSQEESSIISDTSMLLAYDLCKSSKSVVRPDVQGEVVVQ